MPDLPRAVARIWCIVICVFDCQDPCQFKSEKTGRGPLTEDWKVCVVESFFVVINAASWLLLLLTLFYWAIFRCDQMRAWALQPAVWLGLRAVWPAGWVGSRAVQPWAGSDCRLCGLQAGRIAGCVASRLGQTAGWVSLRAGRIVGCVACRLGRITGCAAVGWVRLQAVRPVEWVGPGLEVNSDTSGWATPGQKILARYELFTAICSIHNSQILSITQQAHLNWIDGMCNC